jgi:hypothetical protein
MFKLQDIVDKLSINDYSTYKDHYISSFKSKINTKTIPTWRETMYIIVDGLFDDLYSMSLNGDTFKEDVFDECVSLTFCCQGLYKAYEHKDCNQSCSYFNLRKYIGLSYYFDAKLPIVSKFVLNIYDPLIFHGVVCNKYIDLDTKQRCLNLCKSDYYDKWIKVFPTYFPRDIYNIIIELLIFNYYDYPKI